MPSGPALATSDSASGPTRLGSADAHTWPTRTRNRSRLHTGAVASGRGERREEPARRRPALKPDLQTAVPHHFTVQNQQQRETLRFSNLIGNTGAGDLRLRPETNITTGITTGWQDLLDANGNVVSSQPVSEFVFHPAHNHWHITGVALFEVRLAADNGKGGQFGAVYANQSIKTTFCLIDWIKLEGNSSTTGRHYFDCGRGRAPGHLGRLGRPVPPRPRRPGAGGHGRERRASTTSSRLRTPRGTSSRRRRRTTGRGRASASPATARATPR